MMRMLHTIAQQSDSVCEVVNTERTPQQRALHAAQERTRRARDPEKFYAAKRKWRAANIERIREVDNVARRIYAQQNPDKIKAWKAAEYQRLKTRGVKRKYSPEASARAVQRAMAWKRRNPVAVKTINARWKRENSHLVVESSARRRALILKADALNCANRVAVIKASHECHWCGCDITGRATVDHVIPLTRGGAHEPDNLVPACLSCNCSKGNKLVSEWQQLKEAA